MPSIHGWWKLSSRPQLVVCRSALYVLHEHFLDASFRSAKCFGPSCELCPIYPVRKLGCIVVSPHNGKQCQLLKVTKAALQALPELESRGESLVGALLGVNYIGKDATEGIEVRFMGEIDAKSVPCARYIGAIGVKEYGRAVAVLRSSPSLALEA